MTAFEMGVPRMPDKHIQNQNELEFAVFCIENVAARLGVNAEKVYRAFTEKSNILHGYIVPEYEVLHTQGKEYIVDDLLDVMNESGVNVPDNKVDIFERQRSNMSANPILLQKKYSRVIAYFAKEQGISLDAALDSFYQSEVYQLMRDGISDMHCMSDEYLAEDLRREYCNLQ